MKRPFLLSTPLLPHRIKSSLYSRFFNPVSPKWYPLYKAADLAYARQVTMELHPGDSISGFIALTGFYELALTRRLVRHAATGGMMIDVGANMGYFSLLWSALNPKNKCIAFEASPRNIELLSRNICHNRMENQITLHPYAAGKENGKVSFTVGPEEQTGWGGIAHDGDTASITVEVVRLDDMINDDGFIEVLKVDVEGADTWVLMGCEKLLRGKRIRHIYFEENRPRQSLLGIPEGQGVDLLRSFGYRVAPAVKPQGQLIEWLAELPQ